MKKKLIITEAQALRISTILKENKTDYEVFLPKILKDINLNYEPINGVYRKGGEYFEKPMIKVKVDNEEITPKDLLFYLQNKYKVSDKFLKQVILDWINDDIKDNKLTKNVSIHETKDYGERLLKVYLRQGRNEEALNSLITKGFSKEDASKYIENIKKSI